MFLKKRRVLWLLLMVFAFAVMAGGCGGSSGSGDTDETPVVPAPDEPDVPDEPVVPDVPDEPVIPDEPDPQPPVQSDLVKYPEDGLRVECLGITGYTDRILVKYLVTAENADTTISVWAGPYSSYEIYEPDGSVLTPDDVYIAGEWAAQRLIVKNTPTSVVLSYSTGTGYEVRPSYSKVELYINGRDVVFENVPGSSANISEFVKYPADNLRVECVGVKGHTDYIAAEYLVTAEDDDTTIDAWFGPDRLEIYEPDGSVLRPYSYNSIYIAGEQKSRSLFLKGVPTKVEVRYEVGTGYALKTSYPRVELYIHGYDVLFQNVPGSAD
jgi:hypothetical protein